MQAHRIDRRPRLSSLAPKTGSSEHSAPLPHAYTLSSLSHKCVVMLASDLNERPPPHCGAEICKPRKPNISTATSTSGPPTNDGVVAAAAATTAEQECEMLTIVQRLSVATPAISCSCSSLPLCETPPQTVLSTR